MALTLMQEVTRRGIASLVFYARAGYHTLPAAIMTDYASLETAAASYEADPLPATADQAATLTAKLVAATSGGAADAIIAGDIATALAGFISDFQANATIAGAYASLPAPTPALEGESQTVQDAYTALLDSHHLWGQIRTSWLNLRGRSMQSTDDPGGVKSLHAEISNVIELGPEFQPNHWSPRYSEPWGSSAFHVRLHWLLTHGATIWAPTAIQQTANWKANGNPAAVVAQWQT